MNSFSFAMDELSGFGDFLISNYPTKFSKIFEKMLCPMTFTYCKMVHYTVLYFTHFYKIVNNNTLTYIILIAIDSVRTSIMMQYQQKIYLIVYLLAHIFVLVFIQIYLVTIQILIGVFFLI